MQVVRFVEGYAPYNAGEIAGFEDEQAERLIASGVAVPYNQEENQQEEQEESQKVQTQALDEPVAHRAITKPARKK